MLMAGLIFNYQQNTGHVTNHEIIKHLFQLHFVKQPILLYMLNSLKGLSYFNKVEFNIKCNVQILDVLSKLHQGEWVTFANLTEFLDIHSYEFDILPDWQLRNRVSYDSIDADNH